MTTCDKDGGGVKKSLNLCDVIHGWPLYKNNASLILLQWYIINADIMSPFMSGQHKYIPIKYRVIWKATLICVLSEHGESSFVKVCNN